jgi:hypothetical protein
MCILVKFCCIKKIPNCSAQEHKHGKNTVEQEALGIFLPAQKTTTLVESVENNYFATLASIKGLQNSGENLNSKF